MFLSLLSVTSSPSQRTWHLSACHLLWASSPSNNDIIVPHGQQKLAAGQMTATQSYAAPVPEREL